MPELLLDLLLKYAVPVAVVLIAMYHTVKDLKSDVVDMKQTIKKIADQQIDIAVLQKGHDDHERRITRIEDDQ